MPPILDYWTNLAAAHRRARKIRRVSRAAHDAWFDLENVTLDENTQVFTIPLATDAHAPPDASLVVSKVLRSTIDDTERVRFYDIARIRLDRRTGHLLIECNIPLLIDLEVDRGFEIHLRPGDNKRVIPALLRSALKQDGTQNRDGSE